MIEWIRFKRNLNPIFRKNEVNVTRPQNQPAIVELPDGRKIPKELAEIAKGMESQFYDLLFQEMEKSIDRAEEKAPADDYYQSLLRQERVEAITSKNQGTGIQKIIIDKFAPATTNFLQQRSMTKAEN